MSVTYSEAPPANRSRIQGVWTFGANIKIPNNQAIKGITQYCEGKFSPMQVNWGQFHPQSNHAPARVSALKNELHGTSRNFNLQRPFNLPPFQPAEGRAHYDIQSNTVFNPLFYNAASFRKTSNSAYSHWKNYPSDYETNDTRPIFSRLNTMPSNSVPLDTSASSGSDGSCKLNRKRPLEDFNPPLPTTFPSTCEICKAQVNSIDSATAHWSGRTHLKRVKEASLIHIKTSERDDKGDFACRICNIFCSSESHLDIHCSGKKHQKALHVLKQEKSGNSYRDTSASDFSSVENNPQYFEVMAREKVRKEIAFLHNGLSLPSAFKGKYGIICEQCNRSFRDKRNYELHIKSVTHLQCTKEELQIESIFVLKNDHCTKCGAFMKERASKLQHFIEHRDADVIG